MACLYVKALRSNPLEAAMLSCTSIPQSNWHTLTASGFPFAEARPFVKARHSLLP
ncbi:MAG: hypothetical protein ACAF41_22240 [Leptolyngbya sp. BL-A-14]